MKAIQFDHSMGDDLGRDLQLHSICAISLFEVIDAKMFV